MPEQAIEETEEEPDETTDEEVSQDDNPDIEAEETADLSAALDEIDPDEVDDSAQADDSDDAQSDSSSDESQESDESDGGDSTPSTGAWGEMYVRGLCTAANVAKDQYGDGGQTNPDLAFELELDQHFNQWLNEQGMGEDMPPGQAVMVGTCMFLVAECLTDETLVNNLLSEANL